MNSDSLMQAFGFDERDLQANRAGELTHARSWSGWLLAASLAHSGRRAEAARIVEAALRREPAANLDMVATSLEGFERHEDVDLVLDGLRLAGVPG